MDSDGRAISRSEAKDLVGHKMKKMDAEETSESSHKSMKGEARMRRHNNVPLEVVDKTSGVECNNFVTLAKEEKNKGFYLDLNGEDTSSSIKNHNALDPFEHVKSRDDHDNNSVRVWEGLKRNNYMSAPRGEMPPKPRGRKKRDDVTKKKMELARKEQIDRFAKVAAPSDLLKPGILKHVRDSKQVRSVIEAFLRYGDERGDHRDHDLCMEEKRIDDHDELELKVSSSHTVASENASCLSNEESGNLNSVTSLTSKAANIASQWLHLLNQDINGRLAALRNSKKRVRTVITKQLPLLMSKEFSSNLEKGDKAHSDRWSTIFDQMEKSLFEEETFLENWLSQVNNMQLQCERGLSNSLHTISEGTDRMGNNGLWEAHNSDKDLALRAAAASIYSTCNFLLTMGNNPC